MIGVNLIGIPKGSNGWISKLNPLNWFKKEDPILKSRKFIEDWYNNETTLHIFHKNYTDYRNNNNWRDENQDLLMEKIDIEELLKHPMFLDSDEYIEYLNKRQLEITNLLETSRKKHNTREYPTSYSENRIPNSINNMNSHAYGYYDTQNFIGLDKIYDPENSLKSINSNYESSENIVGNNGWHITSYRTKEYAKKEAGHEESHALGLWESEFVLGEILKKYGYNDVYWDEGHEAFSRLNNVRLLYNLDPNDRNWTSERVKELLEKEKKANKDSRFLNRYSPEAIAEIFNLVADNSQNNMNQDNMNQDNGIYFAKRGNKLRYLYGL